MIDMTKCNGAGCPSRLACYRYTAPEAAQQAWSGFDRYRVEGQQCRYFWPVIERQPKIVKTKEAA